MNEEMKEGESHEGSSRHAHGEGAKSTVRSNRSLNRIVMRISMRSIAIFAIAVLLAVAIWFGRNAVLGATIDGRPVSRFAVIHELESRQGRLALDTLISRRLIEHEAQRQNISVTEDDINVEISKIEKQLGEQGMQLNEVLKQQNMSMDDLRQQVVLQKKIEKMVGAKGDVSDAEVDEYITTNKIPLEKDKEAENKALIKDQLRQQKVADSAATMEDELRTKADIKYFGAYKRATDLK